MADSGSHADLVAQVRRFHRSVTQRAGALDEAYLSRHRPLGHSRVLWEIGTGGADVRALRHRLELDAGYLSRVLHALQAEGLVEVAPDPADARARTARLTPAGETEWVELDRRSDDLAASILRPLTDGQRARLAAAMADVERLLLASVVEMATVDPGDPEARGCVRAYYAELATRFDTGFDPDRTLPTTDPEFTPPAGFFLLARLHGEPVGCAGVKLHCDQSPGWAEVKRLWVSPTVRGTGLGRRLLAELEHRAAVEGAQLLRLDTNRNLVEAIALYRAAGFTEVEPFNSEPYAHHWFEKPIPGSPTPDDPKPKLDQSDPQCETATSSLGSPA